MRSTDRRRPRCMSDLVEAMRELSPEEVAQVAKEATGLAWWREGERMGYCREPEDNLRCGAPAKLRPCPIARRPSQRLCAECCDQHACEAAT